MRLLGRLKPIADVTASECDRMFALMDCHYEQVRRSIFEADLAEKHWVIQVLDPASGELCGFSTQMILEEEVAGRPVQALYSGDTIIARNHWGDQALAQVWGRLALSLIESAGGADLYWFLISKGFRTYRFLPVFFHDYYPRPGITMPEEASRVIAALARHKFGGAYDAALGIVPASPTKDRLRAELAEIAPARLADPNVRFFVERNPGYARGDELCCLAPLTRANFTRAAYRVIGAETAPTGAPV
jgi:hypothetical protein